MIISRTPLRISFFGGGTDYPQWYNEHGGAILGTTINKYCYVMLHNGKSWKTFDLPTKAGLGSSSAYTVGLLRVCTKFDKETIAKLATVWEQDKMGGNIGSQDQYLCAVGGFHLLRFSEHGIRDTTIDVDMVKPLEQYLMLFDTHQYRKSGDVVAHQLEDMKQHKDIYSRLAEMPEAGVDRIWNFDDPLEFVIFGQLLDEAWQLKKQLSPYVTTPAIDAIYHIAIQAGVIGGKLLGAGGGGFIIFLVEPDKQERVKKALSNLTYVPFKFETEGTKIIYVDSESK